MQHAADAVGAVGLRHEPRTRDGLRDALHRPRRVDDGQRRHQFTREPGEHHAIHVAAHVDVGEENIDHEPAAQLAQRVLPIERDVDLEALVLERVGGLDADQGFVLDHEHAGRRLPAASLAKLTMFCGDCRAEHLLPLAGRAPMRRGPLNALTQRMAHVSNFSKDVGIYGCGSVNALQSREPASSMTLRPTNSLLRNYGTDERSNESTLERINTRTNPWPAATPPSSRSPPRSCSRPMRAASFRWRKAPRTRRSTGSSPSSAASSRSTLSTSRAGSPARCAPSSS